MLSPELLAEAIQMNLRQLLRPELAAVNVQVEDWEGAIRAAGELLVHDEAVEPRFVEAMIRVAEELGPYIVIAPGIALPHARPEDGVKRASISMVTLDPPIEFGNERNDPVSIVLALAATDNQQHIQGLAELAAVMGDADTVERLKEADSAASLLEIMWSKSKSEGETS